MKLYYTTTTYEGDIQRKPELSLGGYKSSTPVNNYVEGNLFSRISLTTVDRNQSEYIGLILKNELTVGVTDILLWFVYPDGNISKLEASIVSLDVNNKIENIANRFSKPFISEFYEANGQEEALDLGSLSSEQMIGVWIKRSLLQDVIKSQLTSSYLLENYQNDIVTNEEISIFITYQQLYGDSIGGNNI